MIPLPPGALTEKSRIFHCIHHPIIGKETPVFPELQNELEIAHCGCTVSLLWAKGDVKNYVFDLVSFDWYKKRKLISSCEIALHAYGTLEDLAED